MENQTTAPEVQSEQTESVVQNTEATPQQTVLTETEQTKEVNFKDLIPENFREEKALDNFNNMEDFVKSYLHAQKLVGADKIPVPNKHATEEDWNEVFEKEFIDPEEAQFWMKQKAEEYQRKKFSKDVDLMPTG